MRLVALILSESETHKTTLGNKDKIFSINENKNFKCPPLYKDDQPCET